MEFQADLKEKVKAFYRAIQNNQGVMVNALVHKKYKQHTPTLLTGRERLIDLMRLIQEHQITIENIRIFQDGNFCARSKCCAIKIVYQNRNVELS